MTRTNDSTSRHSNAYNLFIFILTVFSLIVMVVMFLPLGEATIGLLRFYDNLICVIFLIDFFLNLRAVDKKSDYFIKERGWLDLLGSIPSLGGAFRFSGLFRLARLSRLARIARLMRGQGGKEMAADVVRNRSQYTAFITILLTLIILATASVLVLQFESASPESKITTGADAFWYSIVTITMVGYGDYYPVTPGGRITAMFIMFAGIGIIGVLASILSSILVGEPSIKLDEELLDLVPEPSIGEEIAAMKRELASMRRLLERMAAMNDTNEEKS